MADRIVVMSDGRIDRRGRAARRAASRPRSTSSRRWCEHPRHDQARAGHPPSRAGRRSAPAADVVHAGDRARRAAGRARRRRPGLPHPERSLTAVINTAAPLVVLATGATLVVLCGGIDLSIAALASLSTVFLALWLPDLGGLSTLAVVGVAAGAIGALQGTAARRPADPVVHRHAGRDEHLLRDRPRGLRRRHRAGRRPTTAISWANLYVARPRADRRSSWPSSSVAVLALVHQGDAAGQLHQGHRLLRVRRPAGGRAGRPGQDRGVLRLGCVRRASPRCMLVVAQLQRQPDRGRLAAAARGRGDRRRRHRDHRRPRQPVADARRAPWWSRCSASACRPSACRRPTSRSCTARSSSPPSR